mgnify:CR=1 FL=1
MKNERKDMEFKVIKSATKAHSKELGAFAQKLIDSLKDKFKGGDIVLPIPTLEERIARMESMYDGRYPLALKEGILNNIISLRTKKILKDYCE